MLTIGANDIERYDAEGIISHYRNLVKSLWKIQPG